MAISRCSDLVLFAFILCAWLLIHVGHACPAEQLPSSTSLRTNGSCQPFPSQQLFCSQFFNESSMVYIHDNINYTFLNERLFEWRNNGFFGNIISDILRRPSSFCGMQIPYMVCVYLYPPCDDGVPLAFCEDQCNDIRSECCDAVNNLTALAADLENNSALHLLCDHGNINLAGNLYPYPADNSSCYTVRRVPQFFNDSPLKIPGVDDTVAVGEIENPCIYQFGRSYALICNASGLPTPQLAWYYQRILLGDITAVNNGTNGLVEYYIDNTISVLVISNMTRSTSGIYYCNATNDIGFDLLTVSALVTHCYDLDGKCHQTNKVFNQSCSQCNYPDNNCTKECSVLPCPAMPTNCDRIVPTSDGCCMTCKVTNTVDGEDDGLSTGATAAIAVIVVVAIVLLIIILIWLWFKQTIKPRKRNKLNIQNLNMTVNTRYEGDLPGAYNVLAKAREEFVIPVKYEKIFSDLSDIEIPWEMLSIGMELGEGAFGTVYKGTVTVYQSNESIDVAIKTINADILDSDEVENFLNDCVLMKNIDHPNVLSLLGVCLNTEDGLPYIVLPFMANGDLKTFLHNKRTTSGPVLTNPEGLDYVTLLRMCCEIAIGMKYLAQHKFVHRDLAARNCLVSSDTSIKVGDFGLARQLHSKDYYKLTHRAKVPIKWMALESIHDGIFNEKTDVWAFGVTCWEVFTLGGSPYSVLEYEDMLQFLEKGSHLAKPQLCPQKVYEILLCCWRLSPDDRPSFSVLAQEFTELLFSSEYVNIKDSTAE